MDGVKKARLQLKSKATALTSSCRDDSPCADLLTKMEEELNPLEQAIQESQDAYMGSEQERTALDKAYVAQLQLTKDLTTLEERMVPKGYETPVPAEYNDLAQLKGRATVEFVLKKPNNEVFDINGVNFNEAKLVMVIDGYTGTSHACIHTRIHEYCCCCCCMRF